MTRVYESPLTAQAYVVDGRWLLRWWDREQRERVTDLCTAAVAVMDIPCVVSLALPLDELHDVQVIDDDIVRLAVAVSGGRVVRWQVIQARPIAS